MATLFSLSIGERFKLNGKIYDVKRFFYKRLPRIGRTYICEVIELENGEIRWFTQNPEIELWTLKDAVKKARGGDAPIERKGFA